MLDIAAKITLVGGLGIGAQWLAWRLGWPSIVLMAIAGLIAGPVLGLIDPAVDFENVLQPVISLAVALILFEGGLQLNRHELPTAGEGVRRLVFLGAPIGWLLGALAAHYVAGLEWPVALLLGGLLVVTGPTVIIPLLRQARLARRPASILKWEGIVNDPVGAMLVVLVYEYLTYKDPEATQIEVIALILLGALLAAALGVIMGRGVVWLFVRNHAPEYLKAPLLVGFVLVGAIVGNLIVKEAGLIVVTVMGVTIANSRIASIEKIREFKEQVTLLLVSAVFVLITATLTPEILAAFDLRVLAFVLVVLFVVRPLTVAISLVNSDVSWKERALIAWIAPRGIVAIAVAGIFGPALAGSDIPDAERLVPLTFAIVFATVLAHGFSLAPVARWLKLTATDTPGVLLVGGSSFTAALGQTLRDLGLPVLVADRVWHRLRAPRRAGLPTFYGEILSETTEHRIDLNRYDYLVAASDNDDYNALVAADLTRLFERAHIYQLAMYNDEYEGRRQLSYHIKGQVLFASDIRHEVLSTRLREGWRLRRSKLSERYTLDEWQKDRCPDTHPVFVMHEDKTLQFAVHDVPLETGPGDTLVSFAPPDDTTGKPVEDENEARAVQEEAREEEEERGGGAKRAEPAPTLPD